MFFKCKNNKRISDESGTKITDEVRHSAFRNKKSFIVIIMTVIFLTATGNCITLAVDTKLTAELQQAPKLNGTIKVIKDNGMGPEITYIAAEGNAYKIKAGNFVGVYRQNITLQNKKVGGVVLIPAVVEKLIDDKLKSFTVKQGKWVMFVPADISEIKDSQDNIKMNIINVSKYSNLVLKVSFGGKKVSISSHVISGEKIGVDSENSLISVFENIVQGIYPSDLFKSDTLKLDQHNMIVFGSYEKDFELSYGHKILFGTKLTTTVSPIYEFPCVISKSNISFSNKKVSNTMDKTRILTVGNSPVFMIDN